MSKNTKQLRSEVEEHLKMHPLRVSHREMINHFDHYEEEKIEDVIEQIVDEDLALEFNMGEDKFDTEYQWTG